MLKNGNAFGDKLFCLHQVSCLAQFHRTGKEFDSVIGRVGHGAMITKKTLASNVFFVMVTLKCNLLFDLEPGLGMVKRQTFGQLRFDLEPALVVVKRQTFGANDTCFHFAVSCTVCISRAF